MDKITFTCSTPQGGEDGNIHDTITLEFSAEECIDVYALADRFQRFALALGYSPVSLSKVFKDY